MQESAAPATAPAMAPPVEVEAVKPAAPPAAAPPLHTPAQEGPAAIERPAGRERAPITQDAASPRGDSPIFDKRKPSATDVPAPVTGPRIDLDAARARARQMAREGTGNRALLPFPMPAPPERKTKEQIAIEKAWKPKCSEAYKDLGLLAVVPLLANEIGEGSCRW